MSHGKINANLFAVFLGEGSTKCSVPVQIIPIHTGSFAAQLLLAGSGCLLLAGSGDGPPEGILYLAFESGLESLPS